MKHTRYVLLLVALCTTAGCDSCNSQHHQHQHGEGEHEHEHGDH